MPALRMLLTRYLTLKVLDHVIVVALHFLAYKQVPSFGGCDPMHFHIRLAIKRPVPTGWARVAQGIENAAGKKQLQQSLSMPLDPSVWSSCLPFLTVDAGERYQHHTISDML